MAENKKEANSVRQEAKTPKRATTKQLIHHIGDAAEGHIADVEEKAARIKSAMTSGQKQYK